MIKNNRKSALRKPNAGTKLNGDGPGSGLSTLCRKILARAEDKRAAAGQLQDIPQE